MPVEEHLSLSQFRPRSMLRVSEHPVGKPRYPVIDMHNHSQWGGSWQVTDIPGLVHEMDEAGVLAMVDLDGGNGDQLKTHLERFRGPYPDRFAIFATCNWVRHLPYNDFGDRLARDLETAVQDGAEGLKLWKDLGLTWRDNRGRLIPIDDERLDPLYARAGELRVPIVIHVADPMAFFEPLDASNERYEELSRHPDWHFYGPGVPTFDALLDQFEAVLERHPRTIFIGAHVASLAEDLARAISLLHRRANLYMDISARAAELGRQPYSTARFLTEMAGRVVFGLDDWPARAVDYRVMYRMLETQDEYFPYTGDPDAPPGSQGRWRIYGADVPDAALRALYYETALAILPRLGAAMDGRAAGRESTGPATSRRDP
jgi:predicted TIM-barrel fold metal-dependent hydrolase